MTVLTQRELHVQEAPLAPTKAVDRFCINCRETCMIEEDAYWYCPNCWCYASKPPAYQKWSVIKRL